MARPVQGALVIIRALTPLLLLAVFALTSMITADGISRAAAMYRGRITAQIDTAQQAFATANRGLAALATYVTAVKGAVEGVAQDVARLASAIQVPVINVSIQVPGVRELKGVVAGVAAAGRVVGREVDNVTSLGSVPAQLVEVRSATLTFARDVKAALVRFIMIVLGALSFGVVVWVLGSVAHIVGEVRRGWALVRGV